MTTSDISIITITYNNFDELIETLTSTEELGSERIVINGGSCIKTKEYLELRSDIRSVSEPDKGISDAFNKGLRLASKKGVWFLNSGDVCIDPHFVEFANTHLDEYSYIYSPILFDDPEKGVYQMNPLPSRALGLGMPYLHPGLIVSKKIFEEIGEFDLNYKIAMDYEIVCRIKKNSRYRGISYHSPTILMDGSGISKQKPFRGHVELGKALFKNNLLLGPNLFYYSYRTFKLTIRNIFYFFKLGFLYEGFKRVVPMSWRK